MRFDNDAASVLSACGGFARRMGHSYVGSVHILLALAHSGELAGHLLRSSGMQPELVENAVRLLHGSAQPLPLPQGWTAQATMKASAIDVKATNKAYVGGNGTVTDLDGNFSIDMKGGKKTLKISYVGMKTQTVTVGNRSSLSMPIHSAPALAMVSVIMRAPRSSAFCLASFFR